MNIWTEPRVSLIGWPQFAMPDHIKIDHVENDWATDTERLVEFAGRNCYQSWDNPKRRTIAEYCQNILEQRHGSVLAHAHFTFLIEGVSRSLGYELLRHKVGTAADDADWSELSQRFLEHVDVVVPPLVIEQGETAVANWEERAREGVLNYQDQIAELKAEGIKGKQLREAARSLLPNCAETKIVFTANVRALRTILEQRLHEGADKEIRRLFSAVLAVLWIEAPSLFGDFDEKGAPKWSKV